MSKAPSVTVPPRLPESMSPQRQELLRHIGSDQQLRHYKENSEHHLIRIGAHDREKATIKLMIRGENFYREIYYKLSPEDHGACELQINTDWNSSRVEVKHPAVWAFCKHLAAEAIIGVRDLHKQHTKKLRQAKTQREAAKADAH